MRTDKPSVLYRFFIIHAKRVHFVEYDLLN